MAKNRVEFWGEGHAHSNWSDGYGTLLENAQIYQDYDHDFHFACDHVWLDVSPNGDSKPPEAIFRLKHDDISEYRDEVAASQNGAYTAIDGLELTWAGADPERFGATSRHHVLVRDQLDALPEAGYFHGVCIADALTELKRRGMHPFLAHVDDAIPPAHLTGAEISGIEVRHDIERRRNPLELEAIPMWDRWLANGHRVALSAGSDAHQMDLWAASGARNVVLAPVGDRESIRQALLAGKGYVSSTWFDDVYERLGYPPVVANAGSFTPWWKLTPTPSRDKRDEVREAMQALIDATRSEPGIRTDRSLHPSMRFEIGDASFGDTIEVCEPRETLVSIMMHVPIETVRIVADGEPLFVHEGDGSTPRFEQKLTLDLRGRRAVRVEASGQDRAGHEEFLLGNPIYIMEQDQD